jgi:hypothetical protein
MVISCENWPLDINISPKNLGFSIGSLHRLGSTIAHQPHRPHRILDLGQGEVLSPQLRKLRKAFAPSVPSNASQPMASKMKNLWPMVNKHGTWKIMGKWHEMFNYVQPIWIHWCSNAVVNFPPLWLPTSLAADSAAAVDLHPPQLA